MRRNRNAPRDSTGNNRSAIGRAADTTGGKRHGGEQRCKNRAGNRAVAIDRVARGVGGGGVGAGGGVLVRMMGGLSAHAAIQAQTGLAVDIKWPNDLLIRGKKAGGILTEMHAEPGQVRFVIVGLGLNVNQEKFPAELGSLATSLRIESGRPQSRLELLVRLLPEFEDDYNEFLREGSASVIDRFPT